MDKLNMILNNYYSEEIVHTDNVISRYLNKNYYISIDEHLTIDTNHSNGISYYFIQFLFQKISTCSGYAERLKNIKMMCQSGELYNNYEIYAGISLLNLKSGDKYLQFENLEKRAANILLYYLGRNPHDLSINEYLLCSSPLIWQDAEINISEIGVRIEYNQLGTELNSTNSGSYSEHFNNYLGANTISSLIAPVHFDVNFLIPYGLSTSVDNTDFIEVDNTILTITTKKWAVDNSINIQGYYFSALLTQGHFASEFY